MKDPNDRIKKLFSGFEPEAAEAAIQQSWENASYFLPQEKKRRGLFFWWTCGGLAACIIALAFIGWYFYKDAGVVSPVAETGKRTGSPAHTPAGSITKQQTHKGAKPVPALQTKEDLNAGNKMSSIKNITSKLPTQAHVSTASHTDQSPVTHESNNASLASVNAAKATKQKTTLQPAKQSVARTQPAAPANNNTNDDEDTPSRIQGIEKGMQVIPSGRPDLIFLPVKEPVMHWSDSLLNVTLTPVINTPVPVKNQLSVQLFGGSAYTSTQLRYLLYDDKYNESKIQAAFGAQVAYRFKNKVSVIGQFVFSQNKNTYTHNLSQDQPLTKNAPLISLSPDSIQKYVKAYTETRLRFSPAYNVALGFGYPLWKSGKAELSASLLMNLSTIKYSFEEMHTLGTTTYTTVSSMPAPPPTFAPGITPADMKFSTRVKSLGLMPGIAFSYRFYKNMAFIARPAYVWQLTEKKAVVRQLFDIKQNTFYLHVGIQVSW